MKANFGRSRSATPSINVTPLIDVLLVLLIIFMVIQPQREAKLEVKAPQSSDSEDESNVRLPATLMLTLSDDFRLELNRTPMQLEELLPTIANIMEQRSPAFRTLFIRAPNRVPYSVVANLVDLAKGAGVVTIGLVAAEE